MATWSKSRNRAQGPLYAGVAVLSAAGPGYDGRHRGTMGIPNRLTVDHELEAIDGVVHVERAKCQPQCRLIAPLGKEDVANPRRRTKALKFGRTESGASIAQRPGIGRRIHVGRQELPECLIKRPGWCKQLRKIPKGDLAGCPAIERKVSRHRPGAQSADPCSDFARECRTAGDARAVRFTDRR